MFSCKISTLILFTIFISHLHVQTSATQSILYDIYPFIRVYKNGTIQRFIGQDTVPPSFDPTTGVQSKDVKFAPNLNLTARIYLPRYANPAHKIPLLVYYHGGGFFTESAFSSTYHNHLNLLVAKANVIAVSINYRLAPENPLPIAYEDSWLALNWTFSHFKGSGNEKWLKKYADFGHVYLGGDSAGANIANQMAIRVGLEKPGYGIKVVGMFLNCPYFLGKRAIGNESNSAYVNVETQMKRLWLYAYPNSKSGLDDPLVNPGMDPDLKMVGCNRVLVFVVGNDVLRFRGWYYKDVLERSLWNGVVKVVEIAVSVNYQLAPENPFPIVYEDSWLALKWTFSHFKGSGNVKWLKKYADLEHVYLGGDSAGANIANQMAIRVGYGNMDHENLMKKLWLYAYQDRKPGLDDPLVNSGMDPDLKMVGCKRLLVFVAGNNALRFRGWYYKDVLEGSLWNGVVNVLEVKGKDHVFNLNTLQTLRP
ncbi:hypothetical protein BUALT_Bualt19G0110800 [Buddleja alternifolia]|uniref:Alpha/beta hydrolase fold-3 domain-containing protein n=1 Tax=Buddleja alternifolia TaxID=168488 RepID=A0AAV6WBH4_9LAMI|nr:hypothetical protein BUALT_Bualt19G0110800 [Buddleja alternifolia]